MERSGTAGVATLGAAGIAVARDVLSETQFAVLPLVPYLDTLCWVFFGMALAVLAIVTSWLTACATVDSESRLVVTVCLPVVSSAHG